jgi:hypothetical protein
MMGAGIKVAVEMTKHHAGTGVIRRVIAGLSFAEHSLPPLPFLADVGRRNAYCFGGCELHIANARNLPLPVTRLPLFDWADQVEVEALGEEAEPRVTTPDG